MRSYCSIGMWRGYQWDIIGCEVHNIITWQNNTLDPHGSKKPENWLTHDSVQGLEAWGQFLIDMPIISIYTVVYNTIYIHRSSPTAKTPEQKQKVSGCESASVLLQVASLQLSDATSSASSLAASYSSSSPPSSSLLCKACRFPHQHLTISHDVVPSVSFRYPPVCLSAWANPVVQRTQRSQRVLCLENFWARIPTCLLHCLPRQNATGQQVTARHSCIRWHQFHQSQSPKVSKSLPCQETPWRTASSWVWGSRLGDLPKIGSDSSAAKKMRTKWAGLNCIPLAKKNTRVNLRSDSCCQATLTAH